MKWPWQRTVKGLTARRVLDEYPAGPQRAECGDDRTFRYQLAQWQHLVHGTPAPRWRDFEHEA